MPIVDDLTSIPPRLIIAVSNPKFSLGQVVITTNAASTLQMVDVQHALCRHIRGDWGETCAEDAEMNNQALEHGNRLLSVYRSGETRFWIITEWDRSITTVLLPEDY